jgi:predicted membrane-bound spermidine synthase
LTATLAVLFCLSGAAALLFETLWFRQAGLMFGNSVWATSLVLSSFMAGLALGNGLAGRLGHRLRRPLLAYAFLEAVIGLAGFGLVLLFPVLTPLLAPLFRSVLAQPALLNGMRLVLAFALMLVPATAMGATLPVLVRAASARDSQFGRVLGRLYGWNTLGAVAGSLAGEALLIGHLGLRGTGAVAATLDLLAALGALALARGAAEAAPEPAPGDAASAAIPASAWRLLAAAFLCGGILLALEVVWFRFLLLFVFGNSLTFASMLAVVLLGIGCGGLLASRLLTRWPRAERSLPWIALLAGLATAHAYWSFADFVSGRGFLFDQGSVLAASARLMFPVSLLSGLLFPLLGAALQRALGGEARTAGALTLANTVGAMLGALLGGFLLLPRLGMEWSFFALAAAYGLVAALSLPAGGPLRERPRREVLGLGLGGLAFAAVLALFPFGLMANRYLKLVTARWQRDGASVSAVREGLGETIIYVRRQRWGEALDYRLLTNGISMSGSSFPSRRYMKMFAYWPLALNPEARHALLISYGVGSTARALTDSASLQSIDVVDISREILEMGRLVFPPGERYPLDDPRVRVHLEDGRFFLLTTDRRFDLITAEPPPPKNAGIVNLYSREYFRLLHARLAEGGIATYWLPVFQLEPDDARAIVAAFCDAFADCSLWQGFGPEWILAGSRDARGPGSQQAFARQWRDPAVAPELAALGIDRPEYLGAAFLADAAGLKQLVDGRPPLEDDHPNRISFRLPGLTDPFFVRLSDPETRRAAFARSQWVARLWPEPLRSLTLPAFAEQAPLERYAWSTYGVGRTGLPEVLALLAQPGTRAPVLWLLDSSHDELRLARRAHERGLDDADLREVLGVAALAERDFLGAERYFKEAQRAGGDAQRLAQRRAFALALAGDRQQAAQVRRENAPLQARDREAWDFLARSFGLADPSAPGRD